MAAALTLAALGWAKQKGLGHVALAWLEK